jgi:hypothetical protein
MSGDYLNSFLLYADCELSTLNHSTLLLLLLTRNASSAPHNGPHKASHKSRVAFVPLAEDAQIILHKEGHQAA